MVGARDLEKYPQALTGPAGGTVFNHCLHARTQEEMGGGVGGRREEARRRERAIRQGTHKDCMLGE